MSTYDTFPDNYVHDDRCRIPQYLNGFLVVPSSPTQVGGRCIATAICYCIEMKLRMESAMQLRPFEDRLPEINHLVDEFYEQYMSEKYEILERPVRRSWLQLTSWLSTTGVAYQGAYIKDQPVHDSYIASWGIVPPSPYNEAGLQGFIDLRCPFIAVFETCPEYYDSGGRTIYKGVVEEPANEEERKYHAVVVIGHGLNESNELTFEYMNSFGSNWGYKGRGFIVASAISKYIAILD